MKYIAIAVLVAILVGGILYVISHEGKLPPPDKESGWNNR